MISLNVNSGWVKISRDIVSSQIWANPDLLKVWLWCNIKCRHQAEPVWVSVKTGKGSTEIQIKQHEFLFGRLKASEELGISPSKVRSLISKLGKMRVIKVQSKTHFSIITVKQIADNEPVIKANNQAKNNQKPDKEQSKTNEKHKQESKRKLENENKVNNLEEKSGFEHLKAQESMINFLKKSDDTLKALKFQAKYDRNNEELIEDIAKFFAYYSDNDYFINDCTARPYKYVGKLQIWLTKSMQLNKKPKYNKNEKNGISKEFKQKLKDVTDNW